MTDMKAEVAKSTELEERIRSTSFVHMENRRNEKKDVYFRMIGHDIAMYTKQAEDVVKPVGKRQHEVDIDDNMRLPGHRKTHRQEIGRICTENTVRIMIQVLCICRKIWRVYFPSFCKRRKMEGNI